MKKGAKIVLTYNIDVCDGLNNGAKGIILDFVKKDNIVTHVLVELEHKETGKALRESHKGSPILRQYPNATPISRLSFPYNISPNYRKGQEGHKALCIQFPFDLGWAMTIHKVEGATISPPKTITTNFEKIFAGQQAYTVLSRAKREDQLFLLNDVYKDKIYTSKKSLRALKELESRAINSESIGKREDCIKIGFLNVQNLVWHIEDVKFHHKLREHDLVCLSETWLCDANTSSTSNSYQLSSNSYFANSDYTPN